MAFADEFNQRLGQYIGSKATPLQDSSYRVNRRAQKENLAAQLAMAEFLASKSKSGSGARNQTQNSQENNLAIFAQRQGLNQPVVGDFSRDTVETLADAERSGFLDKDVEERGFWGGLGSKLKDVGETAGGGFMRALDVISRPSYGMFEAGKEYYESRNEGQNSLETIDDVIKGFWSGISGKEKTGFGDIVEQQSNIDPDSIDWSNPDDWLQAVSLGNAAAMGRVEEFNKKLPGVSDEEAEFQAKWTKRGGGLGGDLALDPLNWLGIGLAGKIAGKADEGEKALDFTEQGFKELVGKETRQIIESKGLATPFTRKRFLSGVSSIDQKGVANWVPEAGFKGLNDEISKAVDDAFLQIQGGMTRNRILGTDIGAPALAPRVAENVRIRLLGDFDNNLGKFLDHAAGVKRISPSQMQAMRNADPTFDRFLDDLLDRFNKTRPAQPNFTNINDILRLNISKGPKFNDLINRSADVAKGSWDNTIQEIQDELYEKLLGRTYTAPGLRVGNKLIPFNRVGKFYSDFRRTNLQGEAAKGLSFAKQFQGRSALMNQRLRSFGMRNYEDFANGVKDPAGNTISVGVKEEAAKLTSAERKEITTAILNGTDFPNDPKLQHAKDFIQEQYKKIYDEEVSAGIRGRGSKRLDNYVYNYYTRGKNKNIDDYRGLVKKEIKEGARRLRPDHLERAAAKGLRAEDDAFRALLYRKLDSNRKLSRSWFMDDLLDHYGFQANRLNDITAVNRGLHKLNKDKLSDAVKVGMQKGDEWYLPNDIHEIYNNYLKLLGGKYNEDTAGFLRMLDKITRLFKASVTIPYPGFHIRNSIGDLFMSWFDGVRYSDYQDLWNLKNQAASGKTAQKLIGNRHFSYNDLHDLFRKSASSGNYYSTELVGDTLMSRLAPQKLPAKAGAFARRASENREDFFRFAHWLKAFKEEYPKALKSTNNRIVEGVELAKQPAIKNAVEASTYRVNKSLFDYGALTATEKKTLRRIIPFYTYSRKVIPTLMEALFLNPAQLSKTNRLLIDREDASMADMMTPMYQREIGFARLTEEDEPWILGAQFLPTDVANRNTNVSSDADWFRNTLAQLNPIFKIPIERATGQSLFNRERTTDTGGYYSDALFPPLRPIQDAVGWTPAGKVIGEGKKEGLERLLAGRFGLGLPFDQVSTDQQEAALFGLQQQVIDQLNTVNKSLENKGFRLYLSKRKDGTSYRIRDMESGKVLYESTDPDDIVRKAHQIN